MTENTVYSSRTPAYIVRRIARSLDGTGLYVQHLNDGTYRVQRIRTFDDLCREAGF